MLVVANGNSAWYAFIVKALLRYLSVYIFVLLFFLASGLGVFLLREYALLETSVFKYEIDLMERIRSGMLLMVFPALLGAFVMATIHAVRRKTSRVVTFFSSLVIATLFLSGSFLLIVRNYPFNPVENKHTDSVLSFKGSDGIILDFGSSSVVVMQGGVVVEAHHSRPLIAIDIGPDTKMSFPVSPYSAVEEYVAPNRLFISFQHALSNISLRFERVSGNGWLFLVLNALSFSLLLSSLQVFGTISPWPFANFLVLTLVCIFTIFIDTIILLPGFGFISRVIPKLISEQWHLPVLTSLPAFLFLFLTLFSHSSEPRGHS
jgi:hypothetical protein